MYSFKTGALKSVKQVLIFALPALVTMLGVGDMTMIDLITKFYPISGTLTVSLVINMILNYIKNK